MTGRADIAASAGPDQDAGQGGAHEPRRQFPSDNPKFGAGGAARHLELWPPQSAGRGAAPGTGELWQSEHGPQGGDEINCAAGRNYGGPRELRLPLQLFPIRPPLPPRGRHPRTLRTRNRSRPGSRPRPHRRAWPSTAATSSRNGAENVFAGGLAGHTLRRHVLDANGAVTLRDEVSVVKALDKRIRAVTQGPDGWAVPAER